MELRGKLAEKIAMYALKWEKERLNHTDEECEKYISELQKFGSAMGIQDLAPAVLAARIASTLLNENVCITIETLSHMTHSPLFLGDMPPLVGSEEEEEEEDSPKIDLTKLQMDIIRRLAHNNTVSIPRYHMRILCGVVATSGDDNVAHDEFFLTRGILSQNANLKQLQCINGVLDEIEK